MSYLYQFRNVATQEEFFVRARDAEAAIKYVEDKMAGVFDCVAQFQDADPIGTPLMTWPPGEP